MPGRPPPPFHAVLLNVYKQDSETRSPRAASASNAADRIIKCRGLNVLKSHDICLHLAS